MLRNDWKFQYSRSVVLAAALQKRAHHEERLAVWRDELVAADAKLRSEGLKFREQAASAYASSSQTLTGLDRRLEATLDPDLNRKVVEAHNKVAHHERVAAEYTDWAIILGFGAVHVADAPITLDYEDIKFFGLTDQAAQTEPVTA